MSAIDRFARLISDTPRDLPAAACVALWELLREVEASDDIGSDLGL